jgi:hypothetical protein
MSVLLFARRLGRVGCWTKNKSAFRRLPAKSQNFVGRRRLSSPDRSRLCRPLRCFDRFRASDFDGFAWKRARLFELGGDDFLRARPGSANKQGRFLQCKRMVWRCDQRERDKTDRFVSEHRHEWMPRKCKVIFDGAEKIHERYRNPSPRNLPDAPQVCHEEGAPPCGARRRVTSRHTLPRQGKPFGMRA